ncbi:MAG: hypothetical protein OXH94_04360 [Rhodospirillales bacterium]|nr:hypothetical protein [Rhodospirillales bacterium]
MFEVQKRGMRRRAEIRAIPKTAEPFFSALLVAVSLLMSVMLFGAGSVFGGLLFGSILIPVAFVFWPDGTGGPAASD